jgi:twitching motility protein PilI
VAKSSNLREFQETILSRLKEVAEKGEAVSGSRLGVLVHNKKLLVNLTQIKEVLPVPFVQSVPLTQAWFLGVANIRGVLYNVSDLALYLGLGRAQKSSQARVLILNTELSTQVALEISQLIGLRNIDELTRVEKTVEQNNGLDNAPELFAQAPEYQDADGEVWLEVDLERVVSELAFNQPTFA